MTFKVFDDYMDMADYVYDFTIYMQSIYFNIEDMLIRSESLPLSPELSFCLVVLYKQYLDFSKYMSRLFILTLITYI